jgi:hypothetical protein
VTPAEAPTDDKSGFCARCRQGAHALCASPPDRCACPGKASHPNRPSARPQEATVPAAAARPIAAVPAPAVRWEDPPEVTRGAPRKTFSAELLAELQANPGRWARVDDLKAKSGASSRVTKFKRGDFKPVAPPLWEAVGRRTPTGSTFYLRFVGPEA